MTLVAASLPVSPTRVRIAITSPDILAQIRQAFAGKNLAVEIVRLPYVEVAVMPAPGAASAAGSALEPALGPASRAGVPASHRLCAEYRLNVVEVGDRPRAEYAAPDTRPRPVPGSGADSPVDLLSRRQHEVMALMSGGVRNAEIAARLQVSEKTVKNHINRIFRSLGAGSRVEAVLIWQRQAGGATRRGASNPLPALVEGRQPEHGGNP